MTDLVAVGRIGPPLSVRGEVFVQPATDDPDARFAPGTVLSREDGRQLTVAGARYHGSRLVVRFENVADRDAAQALRGSVLLIEASARPPLADPEEFYDCDLVGLRAVSVDGQELGAVGDVLHLAGHDYLEVAGHLVPFVAAIVPTVDVAGGRVVIAAPEGLFDL